MSTTSLYCPSCGAHNTLDADTCFACQHPLHEPVRETLLHNRYRLLDQLGKGGFGAVHRAEDTQEQGKLVAIKQINLAGLTPQQVIEATDGFNREVSLLSTLSHPHLPHIYEHFTDPDHWYLVMDFLEGETLESYLDTTCTRRGVLTPLPLNDVLDIGLQLCTVLDYLHTREPPIIFRDVKPANIMRTPTGTLYLIDFGIARHYKPGKPKDTIPFGSPGYAAPEQYGKAQTSPRSDVYSLGALLHMLLSGDDPVDNPFHFDPLRLYGEGVHELTTLIEQMVSLDVEQRPQNVQQVKDALQAISEAQNHARILPVVATPPPPPPTQTVGSGKGGLQQLMMQRQQIRKQRQQYWSYNRRKSRRGFVIGTASVIGAMTLLVGGLTAMTHLDTATGPDSAGSASVSSRPSTPFQQLSPLAPISKNVPSMEVPMTTVAWSPDGTHVALSDGTNVSIQALEMNNTGVYAGAYTGRVLATEKAPSPVQALAWRPTIADGVAFSSGNVVTVWRGAWSESPKAPAKSEMHQLKARESSAYSTLPIRGFAWSPDGKYIAIPFVKGVQIWDVEQQSYVKSLTFDKAHANSLIVSLDWSSDSVYIAAALGTVPPVFWRVSDGTMYTVNVDESETSPVYSYSVAWSPGAMFLAFVSFNRIYVSNLYAISNADSSNGSPPPLPNFTYYSGHESMATSICWSPDGRYIASGSRETTNNLHIWTPFDVQPDTPPTGNMLPLGRPDPGSPFTFITTLNDSAGVNALAWWSWATTNSNNLLIGTSSAYVMVLDSRALY